MGNGVDRVDIRYMGRKSPPLATMSSGSLSLYLATEYKRKVPYLVEVRSPLCHLGFLEYDEKICLGMCAHG